MTEGKSVMIKGKVFIDRMVWQKLIDRMVWQKLRFIGLVGEKIRFCLKLKVVETNYKSSKIYLRYPWISGLFWKHITGLHEISLVCQCVPVRNSMSLEISAAHQCIAAHQCVVSQQCVAARLYFSLFTVHQWYHSSFLFPYYFICGWYQSSYVQLLFYCSSDNCQSWIM